MKETNGQTMKVATNGRQAGWSLLTPTTAYLGEDVVKSGKKHVQQVRFANQEGSKIGNRQDLNRKPQQRVVCCVRRKREKAANKLWIETSKEEGELPLELWVRQESKVEFVQFLANQERDG